MVFTAAQITTFYEDAAQMAVPAATRAQLQMEGLVSVSDLLEFDKDSFKEVVDNLRRPGGRIPNPDVHPPDGSTIPQPPFQIGAKSVMRFVAASKIVRYYETVGRELTAANMRWSEIIC